MIDAVLLPVGKAGIDRSKLEVIGDVVLAIVDGELTIKTIGGSDDGSPLVIESKKIGGIQPD